MYGFGKEGSGVFELSDCAEKAVNVIRYVHVFLSIFHSLIQSTLCDKSESLQTLIETLKF